MDFNWNSLFNINNPDIPQTPLLSNQELQEDLSLWSNAQFSFEKGSSPPNMTTTTPPNGSVVASSTTPRHHHHQHAPIAIQPTNQPQATASLNSMAAAVAANNPYLLSLMNNHAAAFAPLQQQQHTVHTPAPSVGGSEVPSVNRGSVHAAIRPRKILANGAATDYPAINTTSAALAAAAAAAAATATATNPTLTKKTKQQQQSSSPTHASANDPLATKKEKTNKSNDRGLLNEDTSRKKAAEEDKRRRNTAASARFRVKKKLKEQALEATAKTMTARAQELEKRVNELEKECKWLRSLITEKDPKALQSVMCPCHHPEGLDMLPSSTSQSSPSDSTTTHSGKRTFEQHHYSFEDISSSASSSGSLNADEMAKRIRS
ncbi:hypothetical protein H4219_003411 [Mycoemilia scoparia]|uniref:BZIP domain-containing protein n=1 Tax=Mycoemilia scoparia TaxID=417184 RepID=A0A9W8DMV5_9FUNG|nr:hypothetical protein H4219_003411 [Mycoemilia scoparia]